jgi:hypothetical protein
MRTIINAQTGEVTIDEDFVAPSFPVVLPVPQSITRRQCARELFKREMISGPEMVAMTATGTPPAMVEVIFAAIDDEDEQSEARADFAADTYQRSNPLLTGVMTDAITAQTPGATEAMINAAIDDFFRKAGER